MMGYGDGKHERTSWPRWTTTSDERESAVAKIHKLQALLRDLTVSEKLRTLELLEAEVATISTGQT